MIETINLHQVVTLPLEPHEVYETLLDVDRHAALTGLPCRIERHSEGRFEVGNDMIEGTLLELVPDQRIVQWWRINAFGWPGDHFSRLVLDLAPAPGGGTRLTLEQSGVPKEAEAHIESGWYEHYWNPMGAGEKQST